MKYLIAMMMLSAILVQTAVAGPGDRGPRFDRLIETLQLNDDQANSVKQIMEEQRQKAQDIFRASREAVRPQMEALHEETQQRLSSVLTADQLQKFNALHEQRGHRRPGEFSGSKRRGPEKNLMPADSE